MYLKRIVDENIGPIDYLNIELPFTGEGLPKPLILVGENGSGKTTVLSNIVDALYTMAVDNYDNALLNSGFGHGFQYFKAISPVEIKTGKEYMFSYLSFDDKEKISYLFKSGKIDDHLLNNKIGDHFSTNDKINYKSLNAHIKEENDPFKNNVLVYFGADRYEKPFWMGEKYYNQDSVLHPSILGNWNRRLNNPISVKDVNENNIQWLLDVITDSRPDIVKTNKEIKIANTDLYNLQSALNVRNTIEKIMSEILEEEVYFTLNFRSAGQARFSIVAKNGDVVVPTLDSLSAGQLALFNMFSTIVRYSDRNNQYWSTNLEKIQGIVIVDEIELHLHSTLQREVLPKLLKLFPGLQFIITSHSPLFLLGMKEIYGNDNFTIIEMPSGKAIDCEMFSEFQKAYDFFKERYFQRNS